MFSEYWLTLHNRLIGLTSQKPFEISYAREHSVFCAQLKSAWGTLQHSSVAETISSSRRSRRPGVHHGDFSSDDAGKRSFGESCAALSFEQTAAAKYRSALRRGKSLVSQSGHGRRFPGEQFPIQ